MDIKHINGFLVLANTGNFTSAAQRLSISQSALTKQIQALENIMGVPLFDRGKGATTLNEYGKIFLPYAKEIISEQSNYIEMFEKVHMDVEQVINIGCIGILGLYGITDLLTDFKYDHPDIELNITESDEIDLKKMFLQGEFDLVFIREPAKLIVDDDVGTVSCVADSVVAILPANHPLAGAKCIDLTQLKDETFFLTDRKSPLCKRCLSALRSHGFEPRVGATGLSGPDIFKFVAQGKCVSLLGREPAQAYCEKESGIAIVDITPTIRTHITMLYKKSSENYLINSVFLPYYRAWTTSRKRRKN